MIADYHVHSDFSSDGQASMEQMVEKAIRLGLKRLCFTDHMDYDYPQMMSGYSFVFDIDEQQKKLREIKERYRSKIEILNGVELGLQPQIGEQMTSLLKHYSFDFVIGSTHVVDHIDPYYPEFWEHITEEEGIRRYFREIIDNCRLFPDFHVCGHIDYIVRYIPTAISYRQVLRAGCTPENIHKWEEANDKIYSIYSYKKYADLLDELLKTLLSLGKGIEVNSSGLRYGLRYPHPRIEVLKRYRELGGDLITIGSDAHNPDQLAYDFPIVAELLRSLGYRYYACFDQGKPVMEKL